jgi:glycerophosphoryl diester phosphodiesterase
MASPRFPTAGRPFIIGHRGASGHAPENSLSAFRLAATPGSPAACHGVELDVRVTSDGEFVVHHDETLPSGEPIAGTPMSTLRGAKLHDGSPVPTLAQALEALGSLEVFIEVKALPREAGRALLTAISRHRPRCHVHAFDHRIIARLRHLDATIPLGVLSRSYPVDPVRQVEEVGATTLWQEAYLIDHALAITCRRSGIALVAWTVNDADEAKRLAAIGVDGLCGDWPEKLVVRRES